MKMHLIMKKSMFIFSAWVSFGFVGSAYSQQSPQTLIADYAKQFGSTNAILAQNKRCEWPLTATVLEGYLSAKKQLPHTYQPVYQQTIDALKELGGPLTIFEIVDNVHETLDLKRNAFMVKKTDETAKALKPNELLVVLEGAMHAQDYFLELKSKDALGKTIFISPKRDSKTKLQPDDDAIGKFSGVIYQAAQIAMKDKTKAVTMKNYPSLTIGTDEVALIEVNHLSFLGFADDLDKDDPQFLNTLYQEAPLMENPNAIVVSDYHDQVTIDQEILDAFPSIEALKGAGITKIVLALEAVLAREKPTDISCLIKMNTFEQILLNGKISQTEIDKIKTQAKGGKEALETAWLGANYIAWLKKMDAYKKTGFSVEIVGLEKGLVDGADVSLRARGCN